MDSLPIELQIDILGLATPVPGLLDVTPSPDDPFFPDATRHPHSTSPQISPQPSRSRSRLPHSTSRPRALLNPSNAAFIRHVVVDFSLHFRASLDHDAAHIFLFFNNAHIISLRWKLRSQSGQPPDDVLDSVLTRAMAMSLGPTLRRLVFSRFPHRFGNPHRIRTIRPSQTRLAPYLSPLPRIPEHRQHALRPSIRYHPNARPPLHIHDKPFHLIPIPHASLPLPSQECQSRHIRSLRRQSLQPPHPHPLRLSPGHHPPPCPLAPSHPGPAHLAFIGIKPLHQSLVRADNWELLTEAAPRDVGTCIGALVEVGKRAAGVVSVLDTMFWAWLIKFGWESRADLGKLYDLGIRLVDGHGHRLSDVIQVGATC
ncbi:hypothetical protein OF83DRAFT_1173645 [Amylostereum chailletii]|nr:hypothetical protein OF83DRAFT_1173645 [Amylostereum chailletii]